MPRKVTVAQLRKRAAKAKIKGRTKMNREQLERALSNDGNKERKAITRQNTGRPINRRPSMSERYSGFENKAAFWVAINMANDAGLYDYFNMLHDDGDIRNATDLRDFWYDIISEEIRDIQSARINFHYARSANPYIADMANDFLNQITSVGWQEIFDDFYSE